MTALLNRTVLARNDRGRHTSKATADQHSNHSRHDGHKIRPVGRVDLRRRPVRPHSKQAANDEINRQAARHHKRTNRRPPKRKSRTAGGAEKKNKPAQNSRLVRVKVDPTNSRRQNHRRRNGDNQCNYVIGLEYLLESFAHHGNHPVKDHRDFMTFPAIIPGCYPNFRRRGGNSCCFARSQLSDIPMTLPDESR